MDSNISEILLPSARRCRVHENFFLPAVHLVRRANGGALGVSRFGLELLGARHAMATRAAATEHFTSDTGRRWRCSRALWASSYALAARQDRRNFLHGTGTK